MSESEKTGSEFSLLERQFADSIIKGLLDASPRVDKFCSWVMGAVAATLVLLVSNIDTVSKRIDSSVLEAVFGIASISILFGLAQKALYFKIMVSISVQDSMESRLIASIQEISGGESSDTLKYIRENMDIAKGMLCVVTGFPPFLRKKVLKSFIDKLDTPLDMSKHNEDVFTFVRQLFYGIFQMASAVTIVPVVAAGI